MRRYDVFPIDSYEVYIYKCPECGHEYIKTEKHIRMFNVDICWCGASLYLCIPNKINNRKGILEEPSINEQEIYDVKDFDSQKIDLQKSDSKKSDLRKPKVLQQNQQSSLLKRSNQNKSEVVLSYVSALKNLGYKKPVALKFIQDLENSGEDIFNTKEFFDKLIRSIY